MLTAKLRCLSSVTLRTGFLALGVATAGACTFNPSGTADDDDDESLPGSTSDADDGDRTSSADASTSSDGSTSSDATTATTGDTTSETTGATLETTSSTTGTTADTDDIGTGDSTDSGSSEDSGFEESGPEGTGLPGLTYAFYTGEWDRLPDFATLTPVVEREVPNFNIYAYEGSPGDHYAIVFEGAIRIEQAGTYEFYLRSDDGSRLFLGGRQVIDLDGLHDTTTPGIWRRLLQPGFLSLRLEYFESTGEESLSLRWIRPGSNGEEDIPDSALYHFVE